MSKHRDHGGGLDAAAARFGGERADWLDLSTGINPVPYPISTFPSDAWSALPDAAASDALTQAARTFWNVPKEAAILPAPGASSLIARIPSLWPSGTVSIQKPTYNEHAGAFDSQGWQVSRDMGAVHVVVHPNNPTGRLWSADELNAPFTVIDESFCDIAPDQSHIARAAQNDTIVLKSFGKFWGLAGLRLGFAIAHPDVIHKLSTMIGPWAVSGPALHIGAAALNDQAWAKITRMRLAQDANRLDGLMTGQGAKALGGTSLFRLYEVDEARAWQERLARGKVWTRIFPYSDKWIRLGLPAPDAWGQLEAVL
ncbi:MULTISPECIES: threonine-phosphate decarboxylase [Pacificibacter]|uniref:threonine-phosphate decarboxylase n=1 Tax=Pacificibacter TaxID=1042323 RepID=UPI001C09C064|nr:MULTISPECIES: threonine-phosphate decarboxylase [Pacificibacter]MBU2937327.1 pyridoxal phosphate-dependent class II aminotransferase [Pacificibacter marinus]MDO6615322.1 pyridoxal phosphate-dependent class II aminotransferase [Pacificibacter sp. 1_MG-2023]